MFELRIHAPNNAWIQVRGSSVAYYYVGDGAAEQARRDHAKVAAGAAESGLSGIRIDKKALALARESRNSR